MLGSWVIYDNHIAVSCNGSLYHPSSEEMYSLIDGQEVNGVSCLPLRETFPELRLSSIGTPFRIEISQNESEILFDVFCERKGKKCCVDVIGGNVIDQVVSEDEWFYLTGSTIEASRLICLAGIDHTGIISVSQYVSFIRQLSEEFEKYVKNDVEKGFINKCISQDESIPTGVTASLYPYQKTGYHWMKYMLNENPGCILGDEMGLGKTLQVIAIIQHYKDIEKTPVLIVAPVSLLQNWQRECEKFAPELKVLIHHGSKRTGRYKEFLRYDAVVISYGTAVSDASVIGMIKWKLVVIDEAQNIKNPSSDRAIRVKKIPRENSIAITGTPFENHVSDIWSIVDFAMPGLLGDLNDYLRYVSDDYRGAERVEPLLSPIMIRRLVKDVATDLPECVVIPQPLCMSDYEANKYEQLRLSGPKGEKESGINIGLLQKLRMFCTHPNLCCEVENLYNASIKYQRFCEIMDEIISRGEKVIVFTSYQDMFSAMECDVKKRFNIPVWSIYGKVSMENRQPIVDMFNEYDGSALLILNPTAAGTGLNITSANHVIHYNLEWNPAKEDQATARAYRRGQKKTVFVYRLYYENTVEEIVNERIVKKRGIAESAVVGTDGTIENREDIIRALMLSPIEKERIR